MHGRRRLSSCVRSIICDLACQDIFQDKYRTMAGDACAGLLQAWMKDQAGSHRETLFLKACRLIQPNDHSRLHQDQHILIEPLQGFIDSLLRGLHLGIVVLCITRPAEYQAV